jgi:hypothetical protein
MLRARAHLSSCARGNQGFPFSCGGADVVIHGVYDPTLGRRHGFTKLDIRVMRNDRHVDLSLGHGYMHIACLNGAKGKPLIVFQQYCGGSGCADLANYGLVDPRTLEVLLTPNDTNRDEAARILGLPEAPHLFRHPQAVSVEHD